MPFMVLVSISNVTFGQQMPLERPGEHGFLPAGQPSAGLTNLGEPCQQRTDEDSKVKPLMARKSLAVCEIRNPGLRDSDFRSSCRDVARRWLSATRSNV